MFDVREDEPAYARLHDPEVQSHNRYGSLIDLVERSGLPAGESMQINGDLASATIQIATSSTVPFHGRQLHRLPRLRSGVRRRTTCRRISLSARWAMSKPARIPNFARINISWRATTATTGLPQGLSDRAYTKFTEYGAVLQDPDICFGCGYCTWVCPYNAPQLDPVKGRVEKCNMCVDRLEVGLKPACVSACLGNALNFGVIESRLNAAMRPSSRSPGIPRCPTSPVPISAFELKRSVPNTK